MSEGFFQEKNNEKKEESEAVDLIKIREKLSSRIDLAEDEEDSLSLDLKEARKIRQKIKVEFIEGLLNQKEKFKHVFRTEQGSTYFVSENDQSLRFKMEDGEIKDQPVLDKIIFVSPKEKEKFIEIKKSSFFEEILIGYKFKKSKISQGVFPVEIGVSHMQKVVFKETNEELEILGTQVNDGVEPFFASGIHLGHAISEIIKS